MNFISLKKGLGAFVQLGVGSVALILLLASCRGSMNSGDVVTGTPPGAIAAVAGPDSFLLYPNPQSNPAINTQAYAQAYYTAIDPLNQRTTLSAWKTLNGFDNPNPGSYVTAVFGDVRDLGYGRYVHAVDNGNGQYAFYVDNYLVWSAAGYSYSNMNLDAAVVRDPQWYIGTNAIEISPGPGCTTPLPNSLPECRLFAKYFTFEPTTGARLLAANLDGRGAKSMPGICIGCHGGRGDPLTPVDVRTGNQLFPLVGNPASAVRGDLQGKLHFFEPDTFSFSSLSGFTRPDQESNIKTLNQWVLCTYPMPLPISGVASTYPEDSCRRLVSTSVDEWAGVAADVVKAAYGGDGLPNSTYADTYIPPTWVSSGQTSLYQNVVQPACRMCHILRGTGLEPDNDFVAFSAFQTSADRIKAHIIDRGNMPLTKVLYNRFWSTPGAYNTLNTFLQSPSSGVSYTVLDNSGAPLLPGRPIADPGPDRVVGTNSTSLSAAMSLYSDAFNWSIVSSVGGTATLSSSSGVQTTLNASDGTYIVQLVASKGSVQSTPAQVTIVVNASNWPTTVTPSGISAAINNPLPSAIRFAHIKAILQRPVSTGTPACISCHTPQPTGVPKPPPILYADIDRNLDGQIASGVGGTDDIWFYTEVLGRINFSDVAASPLLRHPSGYHHAGNILPGFGSIASAVHADQLPPGDPNRSYYDLFLNWILNGAPYQ